MKTHTSRIGRMVCAALPVFAAVPAASAASIITFNDARVDRVTALVDGVQVTGPNVNVSTTLSSTTSANGTITYTLSNLNLDDDGINTDSLTVVLSLVGINGAPNIQNTANGRVGISLAGDASSEIASNVNGGEGITYSFQSITFATSKPGFSGTGDFASLATFNFGTGTYNATSAGGTSIVDGSSHPVNFPNPGDTSFSFRPTTVGGTISKGSIIGTSFTVAVVPEPSSLLLLGAFGVLGLLRRRR